LRLYFLNYSSDRLVPQKTSVRLNIALGVHNQISWCTECKHLGY